MQRTRRKDDEKSFSGFLKDEVLDFMAIDSFKECTRKCKVYLLSHHHSDHMRGLRSFVNELHGSADKIIYTSALTAVYLENTFNINSQKIESLPFNKSFVVRTLDDGSDVAVTCIPAGHCPGSVMFVIEYHNKRILYTGDFRMNLDEFKKSQKYLMKSDGSCREIDALYLDSTFALPVKMPHRDQSQELILKVTEEWLLDAASNRKIIIDTHTCIGGEHLFVSLSKKFKTKIVVHEAEFEKFYASIQELEPYFGVVKNICLENDWLIHACYTRNMKCHQISGNYQIRMIRPCALGFFQKNFQHEKTIDGVPCVEENVENGSLRSQFKVYYSHHSSCEELRDIISFISPREVFLNTIYQGCEEEMRTALGLRTSKVGNSPNKKAYRDSERSEINSSDQDNDYHARKRRRKDIFKNLNLFGE